MQQHERAAKRARLRLIGLGALVAAALTGGGVLLVVNLGGDSDKGGPLAAPTSSASATAGSASPSSTEAPGTMTPGKSKPVKLKVPTGQKDGASIGFPKDGLGAISAAAYHMDELSLLDDDMVRRQLTTITAKGSETSIDKAVSDVRKLREAVGLPPSGGTPAGMTVTTNVDAVRGKSLTPDGSVVQVWLHYSRTATLPKAAPDDSPLKDQLSDMIMKWEDGDWKITTDPQYVAKRTFPVAYDPNSRAAWLDGWWVVVRAD
ncbi:hypothetical protein OG618_37545 (plasmid) [Kitasatospora sp. NBC_01246]|uniref:hypothetical protein n=1 Tax=Kitasatospora sp. NBC_01246 TaxID=2903570 RepID=UPI002E35EF4C|nr:hypothetical protein [Kitasatospora sp. NBC_01246]